MNTLLALTFAGGLPNLELGAVIDRADQTQITPINPGSTITIERAGEVIVNADPVDIDSNGVVSYSFNTTDIPSFTTQVPQFDFRAKWSLATGGADPVERLTYFDIIPWDIHTDVTDHEIATLVSTLDDARDRTEGCVTTATTTAITDTQHYQPSNYGGFIGGYIELTDRAREKRLITDYDELTHTFTVDRPFTNAPRAESAFYIVSGWGAHRKLAFQNIIRSLQLSLGPEFHGKMAGGIDIHNAHLFLSIAQIAESDKRRSGDRFNAIAADYSSRYEAEMNQLRIKVVNSQDGIGHRNRITVWGR